MLPPGKLAMTNVKYSIILVGRNSLPRSSTSLEIGYYIILSSIYLPGLAADGRLHSQRSASDQPAVHIVVALPPWHKSSMFLPVSLAASSAVNQFS
jgi:hypothetical protein